MGRKISGVFVNFVGSSPKDLGAKTPAVNSIGSRFGSARIPFQFVRRSGFRGMYLILYKDN